MSYGYLTNQTLDCNEDGLETSLFFRGDFVPLPPRLQICEQQVVVVQTEQRERHFWWRREGIR